MVNHSFNFAARFEHEIVITNSSGWISAPDLDGDGHYDFNLNVLWKIELEPGLVTKYQINNMDIESKTNTCNVDSLIVRPFELWISIS